MPSTSTSRIDGLSTSVAVKSPVHAVATSNIALSGLQTVGGVVLDGSTLYRVLCTGQTNSVDNGIWDASTGSWSRAKDFDGARDAVKGTLVIVQSSTNTLYRLTTNNPIVPGTTALAFELAAANLTQADLTAIGILSTGIKYDITPAEIAASVTPVDYSIPSGDAIGVVNVLRYGTNTTPGTTDMTAAINAAISVVAPLGGMVYLPQGIYKTTAEIQLSEGVSLIGDGRVKGTDANREGVTVIMGVHTGRSVVSLQGAIGCTLRDFSIQTLSGNVPKVGLLLGRSSATSAGFHTINSVSIYGYYSHAPYYSIASEDNDIHDLLVWLFGGGAKYITYTSISDKLSVGGSLTTSSNLDNRFTRANLIHTSSDADSAVVYIDAEGATGSITYRDSYLTAYAGAYVQIDNNTSDCLGPISFRDTSGEIYSGGDPKYVFKLTSDATRILPGLSIKGGRFAQNANTGGLHYQIYQDPDLYLESPDIHLQPPEAFPYAYASLVRSQIISGHVICGRFAVWTAPTLAGSWVNSYGSPNAQFSYAMDGFGRVKFRGTVEGGTGTIFTLPADYRPYSNQRFTILIVAGTVAEILITASTGVVSMSSGAGTAMNMGQISFDCAI